MKQTQKASLEGATSVPVVGPTPAENHRGDAMTAVGMGPAKIVERTQTLIATGIRTTARRIRVVPMRKEIPVDRLSGVRGAGEVVQGVSGRGGTVKARQRDRRARQATKAMTPEPVIQEMRKPGPPANPSTQSDRINSAHVSTWDVCGNMSATANLSSW